MNKITICNQIDYAHLSDIDPTSGDVIEFINGKTWTRINAKAKVTYQGVTEPSTAGTVNKETVTVQANTPEVLDLINNKEYYVLRLFVTGASFIVGSLNYPAQKTVSSDKVRASITFNAVSAL